MQTALDTPLSALDEDERDFVVNIREHGWFRTTILADEEGPGFSFTTGFWLTTGFPEVILFSLSSERSHAVLWDLYRLATKGSPPPIGAASSELFGNASGVLVPVARRCYYDYLGWSRWFYGGDDFPCLQLVWPDTKGSFPWQPGFEDRFEELQPDLTEHGWIAALAQ